MKNIFKLLVVMIVAISATLPASAVSSKSRDVSTTFTQEFYANIDCEMCVKKVMSTLPYQKGVKDVEVDLKRKLITVKYDSSKCSDAKVIRALSRIDITSRVNDSRSSSSIKSQPVSSKSTMR